MGKSQEPKPFQPFARPLISVDNCSPSGEAKSSIVRINFLPDSLRKPGAIAEKLAVSLVCCSLVTLPGYSQETSNQVLPPPPPLVPSTDLNQAPDQTSNALPRETVFQAPGSYQSTNANRYWVYVNGDSPYLLEQVKAVEPKAFIQEFQGRRVIQVGIFSTETNARQQIETLNARGITAELATNNLNYPNLAQVDRYLVVVPADRSSLSALSQQAMRLGIRQDAIQQKDAPLGPHLQIGPFPSHGEAKEINRYLRSAGMDARIYFKP